MEYEVVLRKTQSRTVVVKSDSPLDKATLESIARDAVDGVVYHTNRFSAHIDAKRDDPDWMLAVMREDND